MNSNAIAAIIVGAYLIRVFTLGKSDALYQNLKKELPFTKWLIALMALLAIRNALPKENLGNALIGIAFLGMGIESARSGQLDAAYSSIKNFFMGAQNG